jgi:hypothetical protein
LNIRHATGPPSEDAEDPFGRRNDLGLDGLLASLTTGPLLSKERGLRLENLLSGGIYRDFFNAG